MTKFLGLDLVHAIMFGILIVSWILMGLGVWMQELSDVKTLSRRIRYRTIIGVSMMVAASYVGLLVLTYQMVPDIHQLDLVSRDTLHTILWAISIVAVAGLVIRPGTDTRHKCQAVS